MTDRDLEEPLWLTVGSLGVLLGTVLMVGFLIGVWS